MTKIEFGATLCSIMNIPLLASSVDTVRNAFPGARPECAVVLGSGWKELLADLEARGEIPYNQIPCLGATGVAGHAGRLQWKRIHGKDLFVFEGRRHWYEGAGWEPVVFPAFLSAESGCTTLLLTCAAGALDERVAPGALFVIEDHINAMGVHPLIGPPSPGLGPRFPDQQQVYTRTLRDTLWQEAKQQAMSVYRGVYAAVSGPTYETPAEARALRALGADIVGMSTVPEAMLAHARGLQVAALACITNPAGGAPESVPILHQDAVDVVQRQRAALRHILTKFLTQ